MAERQRAVGLDGNLTQQADARGAAGTVYAGYDALNRPRWKGANGDGSGPFATWTYDSTANGNDGVGRLTGETFAGGPGQAVTGSYAYAYDQRGRTTSTSMTLAGPGAPQATYTLGATYDDADRPATMALPATANLPAETLSYAYNNAQGGALSTLSSSLTTPSGLLFDQPQYTSQGLLQYWLTGQNGAGQSLDAFVAYDGDQRVREEGYDLPYQGDANLADSLASFDAAGDVQTLQTTLVGAAGGGGNGGGTNTAGSLSAAQFTQTFAYDGHGDVVALTDSNGQVAARYAYDAFGAPTTLSEHFAAGWANPYRYDGTIRCTLVQAPRWARMAAPVVMPR